MKKEDRIRIKLILIFCGIIFLMLLAIFHIAKGTKIGQKEGAYIPLYRVLLLLETVAPEIEENPTFSSLKAESQALGTEAAMTYEQYVRLCAAAQKEGVLYPLFEKQYKDEYFVTKEDFETMFNLFLQAFDREGKMQVHAAIVLGDAENVSLYAGGTLAKNELLTTDGILPFEDSVLQQYRFQKIDLYVYDGKAVTIKEVTDNGYEMKNMWVMESDANGVRFFLHGYEIQISAEECRENVQVKTEREQVADLLFEDGMLQKGKSKTDKLHGKILSIKDTSVELEGVGAFALAEDFKAYRLYGTLEEIEKADLIVGYDFTDFVIEDGKVCAGLVVKEEKMETIRVLLKNADYSGLNQECVEVSCDTDFTIQYGTAEEPKTETYQAGERVTIEKDSAYFAGQHVHIVPDVLTGKVEMLHMKRNQGIPAYRGKIELFVEEGNLYAINEVLLEEYLYSVVPSEMPAYYPAEALKAQAVCARTYAYAKMLRSPLAWYGAHVDDSTSYQVYNNIAEKAETTKAVKETAGMLLAHEEELVGAYYYSTSCGFGTTVEVWKSGNNQVPYLKALPIADGQEQFTAESLTEESSFAEYIGQTFSSDFENEEGWYRWTYQVEQIEGEKIEECLQKRYGVNEKLVLTLNKEGEYESREIKDIGTIQEIWVEKRLPGGVADELIIKTDNVQIKVITEHNIRYVLNQGEAKVVRQDGSEIASPNLLPSAFFSIVTVKDGEEVIGYTLTGGGYGHGVGMSQNGARAMADEGWNYRDILTFFYVGSHLEQI